VLVSNAITNLAEANSTKEKVIVLLIILG